MSKKQVVFIILITILLSWVFNIFAGRFLMAKVSTWPFLNRWKILSPQAPIVINNRETIRVSDSGDIAAAAGDIKSKISSIAWVNGSAVVFSGSAVNLTSDGSFVTASGSFKNKQPGAYYVVLNDGSFSKITQQTTDPATLLVFFKAAVQNVPVVNLSVSKDLSVGDKVLFAEDSLQKFYVRASASSITASQKDLEGLTFFSDFPSRSFQAVPQSALDLGEALVNTNGDIVGMWNGNNIISSDVLKQAMALYFNNPQNVQRPSYGFSYSIITQSDAKLGALAEGAMVKEVDAVSPARTAGLIINDVIIAVDGHAVNESSPLEEMLGQYKPGDKMTIAVMRKNDAVNLTLVVGELK